jgi:hypothetical protein
MDPLNAFERQLARIASEVAGPARPVDAMAIVRSAKSGPVRRSLVLARWFRDGSTTVDERRFSMFSALRFMAAGAIVALFAGFLLAGALMTPPGDDALPAAMSGSPSQAGAFPTGLFVANEDGGWSVEFRDDGTCRWLDPDREEVLCTFAISGDLFTEMTFEPWDMAVKTPATMYWDWDGQTLSFEQWEDAFPPRLGYTEHTFRLVPDPVEVVVAGRDSVAGYVLVPSLRYVSAAEAGPDAYTDLLEVKGRKATVDIAEGTPITPDLLEPATE